MVDLLTPSSKSQDGIYGLADIPAPAPKPAAEPPPAFSLSLDPRPAPTPAPPAAVPKAKPATKPKGPGLLARFKGKAKAAAVPTETVEPTAEGQPAPKPKAPARPTLLRKKKARNLKFEAPAWAVSALVHVVVLGGLGWMTFSEELKSLPGTLTAMVDTKANKGDAELTPIMADPSGERSTEAVGSIVATTPGGSSGLGTGSGPPSTTPNVGTRAAVGERTSLSSLKVTPSLSGLAMMPSAPSRDLGLGGAGGGGKISGDVTYEAKDLGAALNQLTAEILRHLAAHRLTVAWVFDESESMKDDQQAIKEKFDRVSSELKVNVGDDKKAAGALNHVIVGFGDTMNWELDKPTSDPDQIRKHIDRLRVDETGVENTMQALTNVIGRYAKSSKDKEKDRRLLIVLITDESGDDGGFVEEARQAAVSRGVPIYIIGRQSLFGYSRAHLKYVDKVTGDTYWPTIRRGPETADVEILQYDGLHERWDEQPSGFAPYELARIAKDSGGIYFLLPSEETMRVRQREKAYSITTLKEYVPDYKSRAEYIALRDASELRRSLYEISLITSPDANPLNKDFSFIYRRHFPINPDTLVPAMLEEGPKARARLARLLDIEKRLRSLEKARAREPEKRWQAHYDLMLGQIVAYQVKAYEYLACLDEMVALVRKGELRPKQMPTPERVVEWVIDHSRDRKAPKGETEKKYAEAEGLLKKVIDKHPRTPWADLAQDEMNRGFGCQRNEWHHNPKYDERAKLVPKY